MIASVRGRLLRRGPAFVLIEVGGVGLQVYVPERTVPSLGEPGAEVFLHTHLHVRENALDLFGFATADERAMFDAFLGVSGIGPRTALAVLSRLTADQVVIALHAQDAGAFQRAPGVGKKTALRICLELAERFSLGAMPTATGSEVAAVQDAVKALVTLGYGEAAARKAISDVREEGDGETRDLIRRALTQMAGSGARSPG
jgi:Holliday junction DNA helicase RuvA